MSGLAELDVQRGVIVAGGRSGVAPEAIEALAAATGWPVLADPTSGATHLDAAVTYGDALLRHARFAGDHRPELIVRLGRPPASRVVNEWLAGSGAPVVQVGGPGVIDPDHHVVVSLPPQLRSLTSSEVWTGATGTPWAARWRHAQARAADRGDGGAGGDRRTVRAWCCRHHRPDRSPTMPTSWCRHRCRSATSSGTGVPGARAHANRGANGIDGVVSTALGRALSGRPTVVLVGDVAFLHDGGALTALRGRGADLRIVVVDNDGGGIFSFLPQASALDAARFEQLYGTPHGTDLAALARAHGLDTAVVTTGSELAARISTCGPSVTVVRSERAANVEVHRRLNAAVAAALD